MKPTHPEEYRWRLTNFHRSISQIVEQRVLINTLWPPPITFEHEGKTVVATFKERPKEICELDDYLGKAINRAFQEIVVGEPMTTPTERR